MHDAKGELATVGGEHWSVMEPGKPGPMEEGEAGLAEVVVGDGLGPVVGLADAVGDGCLASTYSNQAHGLDHIILTLERTDILLTPVNVGVKSGKGPGEKKLLPPAGLGGGIGRPSAVKVGAAKGL